MYAYTMDEEDKLTIGIYIEVWRNDHEINDRPEEKTNLCSHRLWTYVYRGGDIGRRLRRLRAIHCMVQKKVLK